MQSCLVIDEYSVIRKIAWRILSQMGFETDVCETVEEAEALLAGAKQPDILIVSATLPNVTIEDAIRRLKILPNANGAVVLASLIQANLGLMTRSKRAGADGFIYRPFNRQCLEEWLQPYQRTASS